MTLADSASALLITEGSKNHISITFDLKPKHQDKAKVKLIKVVRSSYIELETPLHNAKAF